MQALAESAADLVGRLGVSLAAERIVARVLRLVGGRGACLYRLDPRAGTLTGLAATGVGDVTAGSGRLGDASRELADRAFRAGRAVYVHEAPGDLSPLPVDGDGATATAAVPLHAQGEAVGSLVLLDEPGRRYSEGERALLSAFGDHLALGLERLRNLAEVVQRQQEAEGLGLVANLVSQTLDLETVSERIAEGALGLLGVHSSALRLIQPDGSLVPMALGGRAREYAGARSVVPSGAGLVGRAAAEGRPMWTEDIRRDRRFDVTPELGERNVAAGIIAGLAVPLRVGGTVIGVLSVGSPMPRVFSQEEVTLLQTFADQAALALDNARLFAEADRRRREAEVLADVASAVNAAPTLETVLPRVAEAARELSGSDLARIALLDPTTSTMAFRHRVGRRSGSDRLLRIEPGAGVDGIAWASGRPAHADHRVGDLRIGRAEQEILREEGVVASLAIPIRAGDRVEGLVHVDRRSGGPFTERDEALLLRLADHAALAIARARDQEALAKHADRLRILHEIDRALIAEEAPVAIAETVLWRLRDLLGVPRAIVNLFDLAAGEVEWLAAVGRRRMYRGPVIRYPLALAGDLEALRRGEPQVMEVRALPPSPETAALLASGIHVYMVVPMVAGGELIGSVSFGGDQVQFPEEQVGIAQEVAAQLAIAITQARLHQRVRRQAEELELRVQERTRELRAANAELGQEILQRRRAEAEADRANRAKSEFLSRMSHELRTPLNAILGFAQLLDLEASSPPQQESVGQILRGGRHLLGLINEVLDISRIEAGQVQLSLEPVPVLDTVRQAMELVRPQAAQSGITVGVDAIDARLHVRADRQRLQQVLLNLLSNAVKYNRPGGVVTIRGEPVPGDRLRLDVADTGPGIPPDKLARLFTPFDRLGAEASGVEGTGLGLALSRSLVEAMGGTILVRSEAGTGSTFSVELPVVADPARGPAGVPTVVEARADADLAGAPRTVLYIEDNLSNLRLVESVLRRRPGLTVLSATEGHAGIDRARHHRPDLILLDRHLPDMPGEEVFRRLRDDPRTRDIPVVVLSADAIPERMRPLLDAGVRAYLTKPLDVRRLLDAVDESLRRDTERGDKSTR